MRNSKFEKAKSILKKYNQEDLLLFFDSLSDSQKDLLLDQIFSIDFEQIFNLYKISMTDNFKFDKLSPLPHIEKNLLSKQDIDFYTSIGDDILKQNIFAVVTMAGGQGSRLGYNGPKGTYPLDLKHKRKSLFEIMCEDIKRANNKYDIIIPWFIMTSSENDFATKKFFEDNNFFNYPKDKIFFFSQGNLPIIDVNGNLLLKDPYLIMEASNGNGDVFYSLYKNGFIDYMKDIGIRFISFGGIDNILLKNVDPLFLGLTVYNKRKIASKSIFKEEPLDKVAVFCKKDDKPGILDYDDIDIKLSEQKDSNGLYLYREANILSHLMSIDAVSKVSKIKLPYHRAFKKNSFINKEGVKEVPEKPNTFKFESFIFDAFKYFDDMLLLRVNSEEEFAPIKSFTGIYNPDTAKQKYIKYWGKL